MSTDSSRPNAGFDMSPQRQQELLWHEYELKIREQGQKDQLEHEKLASEFSKIIISNLFVLNAGGLGSIPALSIFFDLGKIQAAGRVEAFRMPFFSFGTGALLALVSAFAAYSNYQAAVELSRNNTNLELSIVRKLHPVYGENADFATLIDEHVARLEDRGKAAWKIVRAFLWVSISCGVISLGAFTYGCLALSNIAR